MSKRHWKDIVGYEERYQVSNYGEIKSFVDGANLIMKQYLLPDGRANIKLRDKSHVRKGFSVSRLVAFAFLPNPENYPQVCHKNDVPSDNRVENLFWGTQKMNMHDMLRKGRANRRNGSKVYGSKLNEFQVKRIRLMKEITPDIKGVVLARMFKVSDENISNILKGKIWKHII